jgi:hypothetical protein
LQIKKPDHYDLFVKYCKGEIPKPDSATAQKILNQLLDNIKIQNNIYHKDVTDAMFRQVYSTATLPFKSNIISGNTTISAVDYDLGRNGFAYNDNDTASYQYTAGVHTQGNRGRTYRNDGVDIKNDKNNQPFVFSIEDGEWLLYTIDVKKSGNYSVTFSTSDSSGIINIYVNNQKVSNDISINPSGDENKFIESSPTRIDLSKGTNKLKIYFEKGGFDLKNITLKLQE